MKTSLMYPCLAATVVAVVLGLIAATTASAATGKSRFPHCAWWFETTPESTNVALPDTSAAYWTTPFFADPGLKITVRGQFPDARFMSVTVYNNSAGTFTRNGVSSGLVDYQIKPDRGSSNPFQQTTSGRGRYTVTIRRRVSPSESNVLPLVPSKPAQGDFPPGNGFITYRVYLPHGGSFSSVRLPTLIFSRRGSTEHLPTCPWQGGSGSSRLVEAQRLARRLRSLASADAARVSASVDPAGPPAFARPKAATTNSLFPNVANAYLLAPFAPTPGTVVVVRGKAATTTPGATALPWPDPSYNLRYWSLCNNEDAYPYPVVSVTDPQTGGQIYGCSADLDTPVVGGQYTYVLSALDERPPNATSADGVAWLPYSSDDVEQVLAFRNMLGDSFASSVQQAPQDGNPASAQAAMGDYYPRIAQCPASTFALGGANACFAASSAFAGSGS
jgi:hypothetical protein